MYASSEKKVRLSREEREITAFTKSDASAEDNGRHSNGIGNEVEAILLLVSRLKIL